MSDPTDTNLYARRWHAILAENTVIQEAHLELISSFTPPFTAQQKMLLNASAARRHKLSQKLHDLVDEWTADARGGPPLPRRLSIPQATTTPRRG